MTDLFKKNDRVLAYGKQLGTVYQDQEEGHVVVHVALDSQPNAVSGYYPSNLEKVPAEHEDYLKGHISVLVIDDVSEEFINLLTAGQYEPFTDAGSIKDGAEEKFLFKKDDRVKLKYNGNTGTVVRDEKDVDARFVAVQWDKGVSPVTEHAKDLTVLHAPRESDPVNPRQAEIDAIDAIRLPLIAKIEKDQAILSKLTAAKRILKKG